MCWNRARTVLRVLGLRLLMTVFIVLAGLAGLLSLSTCYAALVFGFRVENARRRQYQGGAWASRSLSLGHWKKFPWFSFKTFFPHCYARSPHTQATLGLSRSSAYFTCRILCCRFSMSKWHRQLLPFTISSSSEFCLSKVCFHNSCTRVRIKKS